MRKKKIKNRIKYEITDSGTTILHIIPNDSRNIEHFNIQRSTRAHIFKDKTKYTRKIKHKNNEY